MIAGFRRGWTQFFRLLGYYVAYSDLKPTFRDYISVPYLRVKLCVSLTPENRTMTSPETSASSRLRPRNNPPEERIQLSICTPNTETVVRFRTLMSGTRQMLGNHQQRTHCRWRKTVLPHSKRDYIQSNSVNLFCLLYSAGNAWRRRTLYTECPGKPY